MFKIDMNVAARDVLIEGARGARRRRLPSGAPPSRPPLALRAFVAGKAPLELFHPGPKAAGSSSPPALQAPVDGAARKLGVNAAVHDLDDVVEAEPGVLAKAGPGLDPG